MTLRNRAWRRKETRRIVQKIAHTAAWLSNTIQKRKADRPAPVPGAKPHTQGKLTLAQAKRDQWRLNTELREELIPQPEPAIQPESAPQAEAAAQAAA